MATAGLFLVEGFHRNGSSRVLDQELYCMVPVWSTGLFKFCYIIQFMFCDNAIILLIH